jgi:hypothetical protein
MPPDVIRLLEALALAVLLVLILPKRGWSSLSPRFKDLIAGRRAWIFEPPRRHPDTFVGHLGTELPRIFELGVPFFAAARMAERRAASCLERERGAWQTSSSAVLLELVQGRINEAEAGRRLSSLGLPQPQLKAEPMIRTPRPAMALEWYVAHEPDARTADGNGSQTEAPPRSETRGQLEVRTLGALVLRDGSEDLTAALLRSRVFSFLWLYLLLRAITNPEARISRAELADELTPGLAADKQRKRLRDRLSDLLAELPPPLAEALRIEEDFVRFDHGAGAVDVIRLFDLARECAGKDDLLSEPLVAEVEMALMGAEGEFLPGWDQIEHEVTGSRGTAGDLVRDLRLKAEDARVTLLAALARNRMARREPAKAVPLLEQALERRPDREDLALNLRAAYLETGQIGRASAVEREYSLEPQS